MDQTKPNPASDSLAKLSVWPGAFGAFKPSRDVVRRSLSTIVWLYVISFGASIILNIVFHRVELLNEIAAALLSAFFTSAQVYVLLSSSRGKRVELAEALNAAKPLFWKMFLLNILVGLAVFGGLLLLIIPGIIILVRLILAPYFLVDKNLGQLDAFKASWHTTKGNSGKVWGIIGVTILMVLPALTIIGVIATVYLVLMYQAASALLYLYLLDHGHTNSPEPAVTPAPAT